MNKKPGQPRTASTRAIKDIRRATRKQYSAEEKIRIVMDGLRGEHSIAELCRREGISQSIYYSDHQPLTSPTGESIGKPPGAQKTALSCDGMIFAIVTQQCSDGTARPILKRSANS